MGIPPPAVTGHGSGAPVHFCHILLIKIRLPSNTDGAIMKSFQLLIAAISYFALAAGRAPSLMYSLAHTACSTDYPGPVNIQAITLHPTANSTPTMATLTTPTTPTTPALNLTLP